MKRRMEAEYLAAVAKRTRAGTERLLVERLYGDKGVPVRIRGGMRVPDVDVVPEEDSEVAPAPVKRKKRNSAASSSGKGLSISDNWDVEVVRKEDSDVEVVREKEVPDVDVNESAPVKRKKNNSASSSGKNRSFSANWDFEVVRIEEVPDVDEISKELTPAPVKRKKGNIAASSSKGRSFFDNWDVEVVRKEEDSDVEVVRVEEVPDVEEIVKEAAPPPPVKRKKWSRTAASADKGRSFSDDWDVEVVRYEVPNVKELMTEAAPMPPPEMKWGRPAVKLKKVSTAAVDGKVQTFSDDSDVEVIRDEGEKANSESDSDVQVVRSDEDLDPDVWVLRKDEGVSGLKDKNGKLTKKWVDAAEPIVKVVGKKVKGKGKEKVVVESESVWDNDGLSGGGLKGFCPVWGGKEAGDSVGSGTGFKDSVEKKKNLVVEEAVSFSSCSAKDLEDEGRKGAGAYDVDDDVERVSESETESSSTDTEDDDSDEDFDMNKADDVSSLGDSGEDDDLDEEEEFRGCLYVNGREQGSFWTEVGEAAESPCSSDVVVVCEKSSDPEGSGLKEPCSPVEVTKQGSHEAEETKMGEDDGCGDPGSPVEVTETGTDEDEVIILGEKRSSMQDGGCGDPGSPVETSIEHVIEVVKKNCLWRQNEVEILGTVSSFNDIGCCSDPSFPIEEPLMSEASHVKKIDWRPLKEEESLRGVKSVWPIEGSLEKKIVGQNSLETGGENLQLPELELKKFVVPTKSSTKSRTMPTAMFSWDEGTVRFGDYNRAVRGECKSSLEPVVPAQRTLVAKSKLEPLSTNVDFGAGDCREDRRQLNWVISDMKSSPADIDSKWKANSKDIFKTKVTVPVVPPKSFMVEKPKLEPLPKDINIAVGSSRDKEKSSVRVAPVISSARSNIADEKENEKETKKVHWGAQKEKCKISSGSKRVKRYENINAFEILFNSLESKTDVLEEDLLKAVEEREEPKHTEPAPKNTLPLRFWLGEKPIPVEKSDSELELENIWSEFDYALSVLEIGSLAPETDKSNKDQATTSEKINPNHCNHGEHKLALDEEIGIRCLLCTFIQIEIKHLMPSWAKFPTTKFDKRAFSDDDDDDCNSMFDKLRFQNLKNGESSSCSEGTVWSLIPGVRQKLYPHQEEGFEFIWKNLMGSIHLDQLRTSADHGMGGCIISHAPGTGKTRLTISFLLSYLELFPDSNPLIIAPAGMLLTWEAEFRKWSIGIPFHNLNSVVLSGKEDRVALHIFTASKQKSRNVNLMRLVKLYSWQKQKSILGISYSLFEKLAGQKFAEKGTSDKRVSDDQAAVFGKILLEDAGLLVLDEGHTPRNPRSRIYKALTNIQTKKRIILSGTPFQNNLAELYTILSFVRPDFAATISPELKKFCQKKLKMVNMSYGTCESEPDIDRDDREAIQNLRYKIDPFVHVHKGSVLQDSLPGLKDCVIVLNPPEYQKDLVQKIEKSSYTNFEFEHKLSIATIHPSLLLHNKKDETFKENETLIDRAELEACRLDPSAGVKTKFLLEIIRLSEANNEKVLVFSQYLDPLDLIKEQVCSLLHWHDGKEVLQLVGRIEAEQRQSIINMFNNPRSDTKVLLASTKACSEGINLVGASRVVLLDVVWNPSVERQAISRAFRLGQKKVVYSYNLIVGTMEWEKYKAQTSKEHVSNMVFCSNDESDKRARVLSEDKILDELIGHSTMEDMFDRIINHPKESMFS